MPFCHMSSLSQNYLNFHDLFDLHTLVRTEKKLLAIVCTPRVRYDKNRKYPPSTESRILIPENIRLIYYMIPIPKPKPDLIIFPIPEPEVEKLYPSASARVMKIRTLSHSGKGSVEQVGKCPLEC